MDLFRRIVFSACLAGLASGLVLTGAQSLFVLPIIAEAESYEHAIASGVSSKGNVVSAHNDAAHSHNRLVWTAISNIGMGVGFGLLMTAVLSFRIRVNWREGLLWGIGGYATFFLSPALGLPPELPGTTVTTLAPRQLWWLFAVTFTGIGLLLLTLGSPGWLKAVGAALLPVPHLVGAPRPESYSAAAPEALMSVFFAHTAIVNAIFWLLLGAVSALCLHRFFRGPASRI